MAGSQERGEAWSSDYAWIVNFNNGNVNNNHRNNTAFVRPVLRRPHDDIDGCHPLWVQAHYRATDPAPDLCCKREGCAQCRDHDMGPHWRPSIHMPRWASRFTLEITSVRVERLQDITEADAIAEGILRDGEGWRGAPDLPWFASPIAAFRSLWESINGDGSWEANPWLWVVEFKRVETAHG